MEKDLIILKEYCHNSNVDQSFILLLEEGGLVEFVIIEGERYIEESQLGDLEMFSRLYYDLSINVEGIDAINHLLNKVIQLRNEIMELKNRLTLYESDDSEIVEII
ncbi:MAG: chaperone modulator CbpM [Bacteroidales bacterium]|jgi:hypothetical protein|nr:chaperone modulator CbpM [Bacteroidales bacterium]